MPFKPRHIEDLADELGGMKQAKDLLRQADATLIGSWYDHGALEALFKEPKQSNIGKSKKNLSTLSETDGVGAFKSLLDRVDLDLVRHLFRGSNWITARNAAGRRRHIKVYTTSRFSETSRRAHFTISGFRRDDAPPVYFCVCFDGPMGWVIKRSAVVKIADEILKKEYTSHPEHATFRLLRGRQNQPGGMGVLSFSPNTNSSFLLVNKAQFDL